MSGKIVETDLDAGVLNNSDWTRRWAEGDTNFHQSRPEAFLDQNEDKMFEGKTKSLFLPLCGKTPDIKWMYDKGHTVCGVEFAERPVKELFEENSIPCEVEEVENVGKLYKSPDGRLKIYCADLFDCTRELCGQFDIIWDCRSLVAINLEDQKIYRDLMLSLMKPDGQYYMYTLDYDPAAWPGPPHTIPESALKDLYGERCNIELVEEQHREKDVKAEDLAKKPTSAGEGMARSTYVYQRWHRLTFK